VGKQLIINMKQTEILAEELFISIFGDPWHGSSVKMILESVNPDKINIKVSPSTHSIEEIILHMWAWTIEVNNRLLGAKPKEPEMGDWPLASDYKNLSWKELVDSFLYQSRTTYNTIKDFPEIKLNEIIGLERDAPLGTGISYKSMITGLIQHNIYHSAQISILNKINEESVKPH
jgi:hypothetical protein